MSKLTNLVDSIRTEELNFQMFREYDKLLLHRFPKQSDAIIKFFYVQSQSAKEKRLIRIRVKGQGEEGVHNKHTTKLRNDTVF